MIAIGCDHGGYILKQAIIGYLKQCQISYKDYGCYNEEEVDYPKYGKMVARALKNKECDIGILICGTGIGIAMAAGQISGIRAAVCTNSYMARMARQHNDAHILCMGGRVVGEGLALEMVEVFLSETFLAGKHARRVEQIHGEG